MQDALEKISTAYKATRANLGLPPKYIKRDYVTRLVVDLDGWGLERLGADPERHDFRVVFQFDAEFTGLDHEVFGYEVFGEIQNVELIEGRKVDHVTITRDDLAAHLGADRLRKMEDGWAEEIATELDYQRGYGHSALEGMKA
jgi:hypothetical protein